MYGLFFILYLLFYIISIAGSFAFPIFLKLLYNQNYSTLKIGINILSFMLGRLILPSLFIFSLLIVFPGSINDLLFKFFLIIGYLVIGLLILNIASNKSYYKFDVIIFIIFMFLFGLLIGSLITPDSIQFTTTISEHIPFIVFELSKINFKFNIITLITIISFNCFLMFVFIYYGLIIHFQSRDKSMSKMILIFNISLSCSLLFFILYVLTGFVILREIFFIIIQILFLILLVQYFKGYGVPIINITSKIYSINIYHKSGVQLYSYKFEDNTTKTESSIWGNILIGLNHIMGEFIDTNNQINVMQTKNSDIIVDYNNEYGFAVLLIINKRNSQLLKMMHEFTRDFEQTFKNELNEIQDLNNLIDISEFKGVEKLIKKHFPLYF